MIPFPVMPSACWSVLRHGLQPAAIQQEGIGTEVVVEWRTKRVQIDPRIVSFSGNVKATFGPTVLYADELVLDYDKKEGTAKGMVRLIDPDGTLNASDLSFNWSTHTGKASRVDIATSGARIHVTKLEIQPDRWLLYDARATFCAEDHPRFWLSSPVTTMKPGHNGNARKLSLELFGWKIGPIPFVAFSLDKRVTGLRLPAISFRRRVGLGMAWSSSFLLQDHLILTAATSTFPKLMPSSSALLTYSFLPPGTSKGLVAPRTDLGERFADSYMDSVGVMAPSDEDSYLRQEKLTLSAGTAWNLSTRGRLVDVASVSKAGEIVGEVGGAAERVGGYVQIRPQAIRDRGGERFSNRVGIFAVGNIGALQLTKNLDLRFRLDTAAYVGNHSYSWQRAQSTLVFQPIPQFRLAGGYSQVWEQGTPQFALDRLFSTRSWDLRGDVILGPLSLSALFRYDSITKRWYDHEYSISLIAGCFEPYVIVRQTPSDLNFGVRFRLDALLGKLQQRKFERAPGQKLSAPEHKK